MSTTRFKALPRRMAAAALLALAGAASGQVEAPTAAALYQALQALRHQHSDAIYGPAPAERAVLERALADLNTGLATMQSARFHDLSSGSTPLAARRLDFLRDKARVLYRLGDRAGALAAWRDATDVAWLAQDALTHDEPAMAAWFAQAASAELIARSLLAPKLATSFIEPAAPATAPLTQEQRIEGLSTIWSLARQNFVWFDRVADLDWDRAYREALPRVMAARDDVAYWRELMRFTALLRDGHTNAYPPDELASRFYERPGLSTARIQGHVLVTAIRDQALLDKLSVGDELLSIDGMPVDEYARQRVTPFQSSSTPQDLEVRSFSYALLAGDAREPVALTIRRADGQVVPVEAPRSGYNRIAPTPGTHFTLRDDGIAVLKAGQFENDAALKAPEAHLEQLRGAKGLILDLRGNGGGSSWFGTRLLWHVSQARLPQMRARTRMTKVEHGPIVFWRELRGEADDPAPQPYNGPVAMLVDARTFSAAEDTAATFKLMKRGPIIGEATGGSTGQPVLRRLPGGGMVRVCAKRDSYPDGSDFVGIGVQPDVVARMTAEGLIQGQDPALQRALELLKQPSR